MARFDGIVHGVVVQIRTERLPRPASCGTRFPTSTAESAVNGNSTKMDGDVWFSYSTSASARAVRQWMHQCTGFLPL